MKFTPVVVVLSALVLLLACGKDKFETKPRIEIKGINTKEVRQGSALRVRLDFFDKEGDVDSVTAVIRRINQLPLNPLLDKLDTLAQPLPSYPAKDRGEISWEQGFDFLKESDVENDTIFIRFSVSDKGGNYSDTVDSDIIVIVKP